MNARMTIFELVEAKVAAEAALYQDTFDLGRYAGQAIKKEEYTGVREALGEGAANKMRANDMAHKAQELRQELLERAQEINARFDRVKQERQEALEEATDPNVGTEAKLQAVMASDEQLEALANLSLSTGDEDGVLLALRVAREKGMHDVEAHIRTARPDLNEICAELDHIEEIPDYDEDDVEARFDSVARGVPSREELLNINNTLG